MDDRARSVRRMFASIAPRYDFLNHLLSLNLDRRWRRKAVQLALASRPGEGDSSAARGAPLRVLDLCAGTGDVALEVVRQSPAARIVALDFVEPMLGLLHGRVQRAGLAGRIQPLCADALQLPLRARSVDLLTIAFGLRNLAPVEPALDEMARVIRPGGTLAMLEFALPERGLWGKLYRFYFFHVLPTLGRWVSGTSAYSYLPASVALFPDPARLSALLTAHGFVAPRRQPLAGGAVVIHLASLPRLDAASSGTA